MRTCLNNLIMSAIVGFTAVPIVWANDAVLNPVSQRFNSPNVQEVPDFQKHVVPLVGRLGCNGRACHGSFQGQGGFRLSLFGYDFKADHEALLEGRVDVDDPLESLILIKPTDTDEHEGGLRYEKGSWQYHLLRRWIEAGAKFNEKRIVKLTKLQITPPELVFRTSGEKVQLKAVAIWADGTREDVTPMCRFQTNNSQIADITEDGLITSGDPGDTHVVVFYDNAVEPIPIMRPVSDLVGPRYPQVLTPTRIDELVVEKLRKLGIVPSEIAADAEFLRRVRLDMTGSLPTAEEVEEFLANRSPNKRAEKIEQLLNSPAFAAWWTTKLCDYTGNNDFQLRNSIPTYNRNPNTPSQNWYDWIYKRVDENRPYDEIVEGMVLAVSRPPGQSYTEYCDEMCSLYQDNSKRTFADLPTMPLYWARQEFRNAEPRAINFAYAFLGIRIQCAQCHKHPFDQWSKQDFAEFSNFFRQVSFNNNPGRGDDRTEYDQIIKKLGLGSNLRGNQLRREFGRLMSEGKTVPFPELTLGNLIRSRDPDAAVTAMTHAQILGGEAYEIKRNEDIRKPLMAWLRSPDNPYFARAFVNRVWASYFNRGIVEPPDDNSLANPPSNKALLDYLAQGFVESGFDMKWVHRTIANSRTYQLSWKPNETNQRDEVNFSRAIPRRLPAEVVYDAIQQATASDQKVSAMQANMDDRAIAIPGASARYGNRNAGAAYALQVFGKSARESNCDCDRSSEPSLLQTVFLQNDRDMHSLIDRRQQGWLDQIAKEYSLNRPVESADADSRNRRPANYEKLVADMKARIDRLKKAGNDKTARQLKERLAAYLKRYGDPDAQRKESPAGKEGQPQFDTVALVQQAYLRTLSRYPDQRELNRCVEYLEQSEDTTNGVRGLVWTLLNTKEFIVNH